ncbi:MAG: polysaccharide deacetylase family protein [Bacteroidales bacterium]
MIFTFSKIQRITAIYFISLFFLYRFTALPELFYIIMTVCYIIIPAYGALNIRSNFYTNAISTIREKKAIVLTFDLSDNKTIVLGLLDRLDDLGIKAMFFITGQIAKKEPELVSNIHQRGHAIGSHSFDLSKGFGFYSSSKLIANLKETEKLIAACTGERIKYFRPPFGVTNPFVQKTVKELHYKVVGWQIKLCTRKAHQIRISERKLRKLKGGDIILFDTAEMHSLDCIRDALKKIKEQNMEFRLLD